MKGREFQLRPLGRRGLVGVVCGHIHHAADKTIDGISYYNCVDWVDSFTASAKAFLPTTIVPTETLRRARPFGYCIHYSLLQSR